MVEKTQEEKWMLNEIGRWNGLEKKLKMIYKTHTKTQKMSFNFIHIFRFSCLIFHLISSYPHHRVLSTLYLPRWKTWKHLIQFLVAFKKLNEWYSGVFLSYKFPFIIFQFSFIFLILFFFSYSLSRLCD